MLTWKTLIEHDKTLHILFMHSCCSSPFQHFLLRFMGKLHGLACFWISIKWYCNETVIQKLSAIRPIYFSGSSSLWMIMFAFGFAIEDKMKFRNWTICRKKIKNFVVEYEDAKS